MILYVYYIELVTRIPKYIHFPFYDFCTIYYKFPNIQPITEINKTLKKEKGSLGPKRPSSAWSSGQGSLAHPEAIDPRAAQPGKHRLFCEETPELLSIQPAVHHPLCITIYMSHGFALGTLEKFLFSPQCPSLHLEAEPRQESFGA